MSWYGIDIDHDTDAFKVFEKTLAERVAEKLNQIEGGKGKVTQVVLLNYQNKNDSEHIALAAQVLDQQVGGGGQL